MKDITSYLFFTKIADLPYVEEILLYGSRARGDNTERSDIDLAILCPQATQSEWFKILDIIDQADTLLKVDCVRFDTLQNSDFFKNNILRDKKVIFSRKNER